MTVDEAVKLHTQRILLDEGYTTRKEVKEIAQEAAEATKDQYSREMIDMSAEINKIRERTDRLYEASLQIPNGPSAWTRFWRKIAFWRG